MKKTRIGLLSLGLGFIAVANAAQLSPAEALQRLSGDSRLKSAAAMVSGARLAYTASTESGGASLYVFNNSANTGYMILPADDAAYPVLGYADGQFSAENMAPAMKWWLEEYSRQIEFARSRGIEASDVLTSVYDGMTPIAPLLKTKWDQGAPYYNDCPMIGTRHCYTGCVATAMAQVMNYFKYPEAGQGTVSVNVNGVMSSMTLQNNPFDWDNMLDTYTTNGYNDTQAAAVANLMKACGFAVGMDYGLDASGIQSAKIAPAMKKYFNYDPNMLYATRLSYSASEWNQMVYNSLKEGSPVIYGGMDPNSGGHSFVCDGYDTDGYFHFNWGWSGMSDGYFLLNALNPEALGTGGGSGGGFNFLQDGVFYVKKPTGDPAVSSTPMMTCAGAFTVVSISGNNVYLGLTDYWSPGWKNEGDTKLNLALGAVYSDPTTGEVITSGTARLGTMNAVTLSPGVYYPYNGPSSTKLNVVVPTSLPDGTYKATICGRDQNHPNDPWEPVRMPYGYADYIMVTKSGGTITAQAVPTPKISLESAEIVGKLFYGRNVKLKATFSNPTDLELTAAPTLVLSNDNGIDQFMTGSILVTLQPGETKEMEWTSGLYATNGKKVTTDTNFQMSILNEYTNTTMGVYGNVTMGPDPGSPTVRINTIKIRDCETEQVKIGNTNYATYVVPSDGDFIFDLTFTISKGYFDSTVSMGILRLLDGATNLNQTISVVDEVYSQQLELEAGESANLEIPVSFPGMEAGVIYVLDPRYYLSYSSKSLGQLRFWTGSSGAVGEIGVDDENANPEYYTIQGVRIVEPIAGQLVIEKVGPKATKKIGR